MLIKSIFGLLFIFALTNQALADEYIECNNCSATQRLNTANTWARENTQRGSSEFFRVNVIDLGKYQISTYSVGWRYISLPGGPGPSGAWVTYSQDKRTSSADQKYMDNLREALSTYKHSVESVEIPKEVIGESWEVVNCAYCQNRVESFLSETFDGQTETIAQLLGQLASAFNLVDVSKISNTYRVPLEAGGYMEIDIEVLADLSMRATIDKVVDSDGNDIPFKAEDLKNLRISVSDLFRNSAINEQINPLSYQIPPQRTGVVTITDCGIDIPTGCKNTGN